MTAMDHINYDPADFFGFANVPFHRHLGLTFERREGEAIVGLPAAAPPARAGGERAPAAAYAVAEVAAALAACDALAALAPESDAELKPVMLARQGRFRQCAPLRGGLESRARVRGDVQATIERMGAVRKASVPIDVRILSQDGTQVAEATIEFYVRMMAESRLRAMTASIEVGSGGAR